MRFMKRPLCVQSWSFCYCLLKVYILFFSSCCRIEGRCPSPWAKSAPYNRAIALSDIPLHNWTLFCNDILHCTCVLMLTKLCWWYWGGCIRIASMLILLAELFQADGEQDEYTAISYEGCTRDRVWRSRGLQSGSDRKTNTSFKTGTPTAQHQKCPLKTSQTFGGTYFGRTKSSCYLMIVWVSVILGW